MDWLKAHWLMLLGFAISVAYLKVAYFAFGFSISGLSSIKSLSGKGDALAGVFAPLAFGWLVLGFYQQGKELRLQSNEMSKSVRELQVQSKASTQSAEIQAKQNKFKNFKQNYDFLNLAMSTVNSVLYTHSEKKDAEGKEYKNNRASREVWMRVNVGELYAFSLAIVSKSPTETKDKHGRLAKHAKYYAGEEFDDLVSNLEKVERHFWAEVEKLEMPGELLVPFEHGSPAKVLPSLRLLQRRAKKLVSNEGTK